MAYESRIARDSPTQYLVGDRHSGHDVGQHLADLTQDALVSGEG